MISGGAASNAGSFADAGMEGVGRRHRVGDREVVALEDVSSDVDAERFVVVLEGIVGFMRWEDSRCDVPAP